MMPNTSSRGQAFTLEAIFAAILILSAAVFALQVTAVTPLTSSTSSQQIQNQQAAVANGFLDAAEERGELRENALFWNETSRRWHNTGAPGTYVSGPPTSFGEHINDSFLSWGVAVNVHVEYYTPPDNSSRRISKDEQLVDMGAPSENAVTSERTVILYDDDVLRDENGDKTAKTLNAHSDSFYAPDASPSTEIYNVVTFRVTVWRI